MENHTVTYDRKKILQILRDLEVLVVSTDRIGAAWNDRESDEQYNEMFVRFFDELGFFRKLADARTVLSDAFPREACEEEVDELKRELQDLKFWGDKRT